MRYILKAIIKSFFITAGILIIMYFIPIPFWKDLLSAGRKPAGG